MNDSERINALISSLVQSLNDSHLPLAVKKLALENILLSIKVAEYQNAEGGEKDA